MGDNDWRELFLDAARDGRVSTELTPSGSFKPAFPPASTADEDAYIEKMIARDRASERNGWGL